MKTIKGVLNNLVNPFGITDSSRVDQALKEISELLVECKPEEQKAFHKNCPNPEVCLVCRFTYGYDAALDDYEKNIKARLQ